MYIGAFWKKLYSRRLLFLSSFFIFHSSFCLAQTYDTEFYPEEFDFEVDESVFVTPAWGAKDVFGDFARYRFNTVRYRERGLDDRHYRVSLGGVELTDNISGYPDWSLITLARRGGLASERVPAMVGGAMGRGENYALVPAEGGFYVSLRSGDRYSQGGADVRFSSVGEGGWRTLLAATGEMGRDGHIDGLGSQGGGGLFSVGKEWRGGTRLTLFGAANVSERGVRTAVTEEATALTANDLYNPVWGMQNGRVRNSRLNRVRQIFGALELVVPFSERVTLSVTAGYRHSRNGRTRLAWYDTHSPLPDYYRSMPSFFPDWSAAETIADAWRANDLTVTQLDWDSFYYNNTLSADGRATYIVEEQVEQARDIHFSAAINTLITNDLRLEFGVRARLDESRFFKVADDLLGAEWVANIDQYVTDTDGEYHTGAPNENDLRNPGRQVRRGERFGYDYSFVRMKPSVFGVIDWQTGNYGVVASASITYSRLWREGFYEKELFPGALSFGRSAEVDFTTASVSLSAFYNPSARHAFSIAAMAATQAPFAADMFLSPEQNNLTVSELRPSGLYGAELAWAFTGEAVRLKVAGFVNSSTGETDVRRYYDDLSSTFSDMVVAGISRLGFGVELGAEVRLARPLTLRLGGSIGDFRYNSEPEITLYDDATGDVTASQITGYISGLKTGLPQIAGAVELEYYDRRRWRASVSGEFLGGRHVEINPLYHSSRIVGINPAPEIMNEFFRQSQMPDAVAISLSLSKGWVVGRGYLRVAGGVRNLLSNSILYSGYEQMRIRRVGTGINRTLVPFPAKFLHAWPMTWNISVSYRL